MSRPRPALRMLIALAGTLAAPAGAVAAPLRDLDWLPVLIVPGSFGMPDTDGRYWISADTGLAGMQPIQQVSAVHLWPSDGPRALPGRTRFTLRLHARDTPPAELLVNITATNQRCLLTAIDPVLNQASLSGRLVQITPRLTLSDRTKMPQMGSTSSLCTGEAGRMTIFFSPPSFDMVEMVAVSNDPIRGYGVAAQFVMLPLPTSLPVKGIRP